MLGLSRVRLRFLLVTELFVLGGLLLMVHGLTQAVEEQPRPICHVTYDTDGRIAAVDEFVPDGCAEYTPTPSEVQFEPTAELQGYEWPIDASASVAVNLDWKTPIEMYEPIAINDDTSTAAPVDYDYDCVNLVDGVSFGRHMAHFHNPFWPICYP